MRYFLLVSAVSIFLLPIGAYAQSGTAVSPESLTGAVALGATTSTTTLQEVEQTNASTPQRAPVLPEEKQVTPSVFSERPTENITFFNFIAYFIQQAASAGVPTETIALVLLLPFLVTIVAFVRNIVGLTTLDMLVPVVFAIAILASGFLMGVILLGTIVLSSVFARIVLRQIRIMQLPRVALSMIIVSVIVLTVLTSLALEGTLAVKDVSIVPILLFMLLSERIVRLQFEVAFLKTLFIVITTLAIGTIGYLLLAMQITREMILLYPELVLLLIPINFIIGRYFGLRFTEYIRFGNLQEE